MLKRSQKVRLQSLLEDAYTLEPRLVKVIEDSVAQTLRQAYEDCLFALVMKSHRSRPSTAPRIWLATLWGDDHAEQALTSEVNLAYRYGERTDVNELLLPDNMREIAIMYGRLTAQVKKTALPNLTNVLGRRTSEPVEVVLRAYVDALEAAKLDWQAQNIGPNKGGVHFLLYRQ